METLANKNDHIRVQIRLHGTKRHVTINGIIDSGATEELIDKGFYSKYNIKCSLEGVAGRVFTRQTPPLNGAGGVFLG